MHLVVLSVLGATHYIKNLNMNFPFKQQKELAPLFLRLIFGIYLFLSLKAAVYTPTAINDFATSLAGLGLPAATFLAYLGTWSVLISYCLLLIGWKTRWAAIPVIIYFTVALVWGHIIPGHGLSKMISAIVLLVLGIFFLLNGPGKPSVDEGV
jgi:putative oxidoreductase